MPSRSKFKRPYNAPKLYIRIDEAIQNFDDNHITKRKKKYKKNNALKKIRDLVHHPNLKMKALSNEQYDNYLTKINKELQKIQNKELPEHLKFINPDKAKALYRIINEVGHFVFVTAYMWVDGSKNADVIINKDVYNLGKLISQKQNEEAVKKVLEWRAVVSHPYDVVKPGIDVKNLDYKAFESYVKEIESTLKEVIQRTGDYTNHNETTLEIIYSYITQRISKIIGKYNHNVTEQLHDTSDDEGEILNYYPCPPQNENDIQSGPESSEDYRQETEGRDNEDPIDPLDIDELLKL